jgi:hypothetical protein
MERKKGWDTHLEHRPTAHIDRAHEIRSKLPIRMTELTCWHAYTEPHNEPD